LPPPPDCADFGADADVCVVADAFELFEPETPPSSQDARVAARPMALTAARIRFEAVIMIGPPMLSIRPLRPAGILKLYAAFLIREMGRLPRGENV